MRDINQFTITEAVKKTFETEPGSRFEKLLHSFLDHLHDFTRENQITHEEWMGVLNFLYDCGQISTPERHEFILLSDVVGFSALVDMINTKGGATEGSNLGPFYLDEAPLSHQQHENILGPQRVGVQLFAEFLEIWRLEPGFSIGTENLVPDSGLVGFERDPM